MTPELRSDRLFMRRISEIDWPLFFHLHRDPVVVEKCFDVPGEVEIKDRFLARLPDWTLASKEWLCLVVAETATSRLVGVTGFRLLAEDSTAAEVGYLFLPDFHGKGYATESLLQVMAYAVERLGINRFTAVVTAGNQRSCRVLEKCGFVQTTIIKDNHKIGEKLYDDVIFESYRSNKAL